MDYAFWDLLPAMFVRGGLFIAGLSMMVHFALMAHLAPTHKTPWYVLDSLMAVATCGMWIVCTSIGGTLQELQLATAVSAIGLLTFVFAIWIFGFKLSLFVKYGSVTVKLWEKLNRKDQDRKKHRVGV